MSPRTFVARGAALLALASLGLAACESKTVIPPTPPPALQILVTPSSLSFTAAGQKAQVVASLTGGDTGQAAQGVTWSSSNSAVATVDQSGVVTAVANGTTTIVATSKALSSVVGAASVVVNIPVPPKPDTTKPAPPSVSIASITQQNGQQVDLTNVQGTIYVTLNVDVPTGNVVSSVNWLIDGKTVCSQAFSAPKSAGLSVASAAASTVTCQINTTTLAAPLNTNGAHQLSATLVGPSGTVTATSSQTLVFNNQNSITASISADTSAFGPNGFIWYGKNVTVTSTPTIFSGATVGRVIFSLVRVSDNQVIATYTDSVAPFIVTFAADSTRALPTGSVYATLASGQIGLPLKGMTDSVNVRINTVTTAGTTGPANGTATLWYDNTAPAKVLYFLNDADKWKNGAFTFSSAIDTTKDNTNAARSGAVDAGVDRVTYTFYAGPAYDTMAVVTTTNDLAESTTNSRYLTKVVIKDALGNSTTVFGNVATAGDTSAATARFGIDKQAPTIGFAPVTVIPSRVAADSMFKTAPTGFNFAVEYADQGASGFASARPVKVIVVRYDTASATNDCLVGSGGTTVAKCTKPDSTNSLQAVPDQEGYLVYTGYVQDQAGNKSAVITETVLVDKTAPTVPAAGFSGPTTLKGGAAATFTDTARDNLDLGTYKAYINYNGLFSLPAGTGTLGTYGFDALTTSGLMTATSSAFIRSIQAGVGGTVYPANSVRFIVKDVAGNVSADSANAITPPAAVAFTGINGWAITSVATDPATLEATLTVDTTVTKSSPFVSVQVYKLKNGIATPIGTAASPLISDVGAVRNFRYQLAAPTLADGDVIIFIGVTKDGDALASAPQTVTIS